MLMGRLILKLPEDVIVSDLLQNKPPLFTQSETREMGQFKKLPESLISVFFSLAVVSDK